MKTVSFLVSALALFAGGPVFAKDYACLFNRMCTEQELCLPTQWRVSLLQTDDGYLLKDKQSALNFQVLADGHGNLHMSHVPNPGTAAFLSKLADGTAVVSTHFFFVKASITTHTGTCEVVE